MSRPLLLEGLHVTNDVDLRADIELSRGWIQLPAAAGSHFPAHERGVVLSEPGLYFMSLPSQFGHNSALIDDACIDAEHVVAPIAASRQQAKLLEV